MNGMINYPKIDSVPVLRKLSIMFSVQNRMVLMMSNYSGFMFSCFIKTPRMQNLTMFLNDKWK